MRRGPGGRVVLRSHAPEVSLPVIPRAVWAALALAAATPAGLVASVGYGEYPVGPMGVVRTVLGIGSQEHSFIVTELRLPRALAAFLVGVGIAVSGAALQGLTRNPLAAPDIIGVNAGAVLAAVTMIVAFSAAPAALLPLVAFAGACVVALLLYALAWRGSTSPIRLVLVGVGLTAVATAVKTVMITFGDIYQVSQAMVWLAGSVYGRGWDEVWTLLPWLAVFVPLALSRSRHLNALALGEEVARGLGSRVDLERGLLLLASVALAGASVATAGMIVFVGLTAPHIARRLVGPAHGALLPIAAMTGGALVVLADLAGRTLFAPIEVPCGIITGALGAPFFLYLLYRDRDA